MVPLWERIDFNSDVGSPWMADAALTKLPAGVIQDHDRKGSPLIPEHARCSDLSVGLVGLYAHIRRRRAAPDKPNERFRLYPCTAVAARSRKDSAITSSKCVKENGF
jgi:hypothetical protein